MTPQPLGCTDQSAGDEQTAFSVIFGDEKLFQARMRRSVFGFFPFMHRKRQMKRSATYRIPIRSMISDFMALLPEIRSIPQATPIKNIKYEVLIKVILRFRDSFQTHFGHSSQNLHRTLTKTEQSRAMLAGNSRRKKRAKNCDQEQRRRV
jgi:hypothetical protein